MLPPDVLNHKTVQPYRGYTPLTAPRPRCRSDAGDRDDSPAHPFKPATGSSPCSTTPAPTPAPVPGSAPPVVPPTSSVPPPPRPSVCGQLLHLTAWSSGLHMHQFSKAAPCLVPSQVAGGAKQQEVQTGLHGLAGCMMHDAAQGCKPALHPQ